jgi:DNA replication and repair protein RecF
VDREFLCSDQGGLILGPNGSGKTNLFEAIAYSSLGKSVRYQSDEHLLMFGTQKFSLQADFQLRIGECRIISDYNSGKKRISINQIPVKHLSQVYEYVKVVYCAPEDVYLVNGNPRRRRQYFDLAIAQLDPLYISQLRHYNHIVEQRNILLKSETNKKQKKHWDDLFLQAAVPLVGTRLNYITQLNRKIQEQYRDTLSEVKALQISYTPSLNPIDDDKLRLTYDKELKRIESREWQYQRTLIGPHLDDYDICLDTKPVKDIGSQGQKRTVTLLMKIAHLELIKSAIGEYPILLLDDIFAELDQQHTQRFMQILKNHEQVFVASPNAITAANWPELPIINLYEKTVIA